MVFYKVIWIVYNLDNFRFFWHCVYWFIIFMLLCHIIIVTVHSLNLMTVMHGKGTQPQTNNLCKAGKLKWNHFVFLTIHKKILWNSIWMIGKEVFSKTKAPKPCHSRLQIIGVWFIDWNHAKCVKRFLFWPFFHWNSWNFFFSMIHCCNRYSGQQKFTEAADLLYRGALILMQHNQVRPPRHHRVHFIWHKIIQFNAAPFNI